ERDISHSSVERVALPDAAIATDYLLHLTTGLVSGLVVDTARMRANLELTGGLIYTSGVLLALVAAGMSREDAYALVQAAAMETWETGTGFREALRKQAAGQGLTLDEAALDEVTRPERYGGRPGPVCGRARLPAGRGGVRGGTAAGPRRGLAAAGAHLHAGDRGAARGAR